MMYLFVAEARSCIQKIKQYFEKSVLTTTFINQLWIGSLPCLFTPATYKNNVRRCYNEIRRQVGATPRDKAALLMPMIIVQQPQVMLAQS